MKVDAHACGSCREPIGKWEPAVWTTAAGRVRLESPLSLADDLDPDDPIVRVVHERCAGVSADAAPA